MQFHDMNQFRSEELRAAIVLKAFLIITGHKASFRRNRKDPPDIVFRVDGEKWAVEPTTLHQYIQGGKVGLSREAATAQAERIHHKLNEATAGILTSSWIVNLAGRFPNKRTEKAAVDCILKAVISGDPKIINELYPGEKIGLMLSPCDKISVKRIESESGGPNMVILSGISSGGLVPKYNKPAADVRAQIDYALDEIERRKVPRLRTVQGYNKRVLLIDNRFLGGEPELVTQSIRGRSGLRSTFDELFFEVDGTISIVWE